MKVYLAGPITGLTYDEGQSWRDVAAAELGSVAFSPLRGKEYLRGVGKLTDTYFDIHPMSTPKGIVTRDHYDVRTSDVLLVNLFGAERVSIGTMIEFGWAHAYGVPIVLVMEGDGNLHDHAMVTEMAGYITPDLYEAIRIVKVMLGLEGGTV